MQKKEYRRTMAGGVAEKFPHLAAMKSCAVCRQPIKATSPHTRKKDFALILLELHEVFMGEDEVRER